MAFAAIWVGGFAIFGGGEAVVRARDVEPFPPGTFSAPIDADERDCGEYEAPESFEQERAERGDELGCLLAAFRSGQPAVLVRHGRSEDGYPIRTQIRVLGPSRLEILQDATRVASSDAGTSRTICTGVTASDAGVLPDDCRAVRAP